MEAETLSAARVIAKTKRILHTGAYETNLEKMKQKPVGRRRWHLATLLTLDTVNNYLDRMTLPVAIIAINMSFEISESQYALLSSAFLLAYAIMYAGGGRLMDKLGTYWGFLLINIFWGLAVIAHGFMNSFVGLLACRFLLGLGEGGGFPASSKAVSEWFPAKERSTAFGYFNSGSSIGSIVAVPLFAFIILVLNWRWVFFVSGMFGFIWAFFWIRFFRLKSDKARTAERLPEHNAKISSEELAYIQSALASEELAEHGNTSKHVNWLQLFQHKELLALIIAKFFTDAVWYFYIFWTPKYLFDARGFDIREVGYFGWIPFAAAAIGSLSGGTLSSVLIRRGMSINRSRKIALGIAAMCLPISAAIVSAPTAWAIAFICAAYFGHQFWNVIIQTLPADLFPKYKVGSVAGIIGSAGALGGFCFQFLADWMMTALGGYGSIFITLSLMHPLSFVVIMIMIPRIRRLTN